MARRICQTCGRVSILARPRGRALLSLRKLFANALMVSILARPRGRALPVPQPFAPEDGRYHASPRQADHGRVSILARPRGRALPAYAVVLSPPGGFNPRPPQRTGATVGIQKL